MIETDLILISISLAALAFATITDIKIKEVPDWLSYALISSGLAIRLIHAFIFSEFSYFFFGILGFAIMFIVGNVLYHTKQWGGGDAKLLMGLGATLATTPFYLESNIPFLLILFIYILLSGAVYGIFWSLTLIFKNTQKFTHEFKNVNKTKTARNLKIISFIGTILFIILLIAYSERELIFLLLVLTIVTLLYPYLFISVKSVENLYLYTTFPVEKLMEGDWVANNVKKNNKIIFHKKLAITKQDIETLKKLNVKTVVIKDGIPFVPPFLIGTILALTIGNPF